jgi:hypothetical protein
MKQFNAFTLTFVLSVLTSILITILALLVSPKVGHSQSGNFNLFGGQEILAAFIVGCIYGGILGTIVGLLSGGFFSTVVVGRENSTEAYALVVAFALLTGFGECVFFYFADPSRFSEDGPILPVYLVISGFLTSLIPQLLAKKWFGF